MIQSAELLKMIKDSIWQCGPIPETAQAACRKMTLLDVLALVKFYIERWNLAVMPVNPDEAEVIAKSIDMDHDQIKGFKGVSESVGWFLRDGRILNDRL